MPHSLKVSTFQDMERLNTIIEYLDTVNATPTNRRRCLLRELLVLSPGSIIVSPIQVEILIWLQAKGELGIRVMDAEQWTNLVWEGEHSLLFEGHVDGQNLLTDQMERATALVAEMRSQGLRRLKTMDGHGRFLACFFRALQIAGEPLSDYEIEICDIDAHANTWHESMFPSNVIVRHINIMGDISDIARNTMLYLNFCSLGDQGNSMLCFLDSALYTYRVPCIMLSFLIRNARGGGVLATTMRSLNIDFDWSSISQRGLFISTFVRPKQRGVTQDDSCEPSESKRRRT